MRLSRPRPFRPFAACGAFNRTIWSKTMMNPRLCLLVGAIAVAMNIAVASAREPDARPVAEQSGRAEQPSPTAKVRDWTRAQWDAARKHWAQDNARFYACNSKWREQTEGRRFSLRDQREFLFQCMNSK